MDPFAGKRYYATKIAERARFGRDRVQRIDLYPYGDRPPDEAGDTLSLRDELVRALVLRCEHRGAAKFFVGLRPVGDPVEAASMALRLQPVVGIILVLDAARLTEEVVARMAALESSDRIRIGIPFRPHELSGFRIAAVRARAHALSTVVRAMSGPAGDAKAGFAGLADVANDCRVCGLHAMPWQRLAAPAGYDGDPMIPPAPFDEQPPDRLDYLDAVADVIERLSPTIEVDLRGHAGPRELVSEPAWLTDGKFGAGLTAVLTRRNTHQGFLLEIPDG